MNSFLRKLASDITGIKMNTDRRAFLSKAGLAGAAAVGTGLLGASQSRAAERATPDKHNTAIPVVPDADVLNFALNLEYLEAEFYLHATTGSGLSNADITGVLGRGHHVSSLITPGGVTGGRQVNFTVPAIQTYAQEITADELAHVKLLRSALGSAAVARPAIDIQNSFNLAAQAAGIGQSFDPYASDDNFLLGAFVFEDVGVTAYHGAAPLISKAVVGTAAGILGTEAYHAGIIRSTIYARGLSNPSLITTADQISALRAAADGSRSGGHERPIVDANGNTNIVPTDATAVTFARTTAEVLRIVYLNQSPAGGFFPNGLNGPIY